MQWCYAIQAAHKLKAKTNDMQPCCNVPIIYGNRMLLFLSRWVSRGFAVLGDLCDLCSPTFFFLIQHFDFFKISRVCQLMDVQLKQHSNWWFRFSAGNRTVGQSFTECKFNYGAKHVEEFLPGAITLSRVLFCDWHRVADNLGIRHGHSVAEVCTKP